MPFTAACLVPPSCVADVANHPNKCFGAPRACPPLRLHSHPFVATTWVVLALYNTMNSHSGYAIPFVGDPLAHDWHHEVCA